MFMCVLCCILILAFTQMATAAPLPLTPSQNGTVSGDLYVGAFQPTPWNNQSTTPGVKTFTQAYTFPAYTNIQWARLYTVVYAAGTDNRTGRATISFDGNGDGGYETSLGVETLNISSTADQNGYWLNDHCNKVYSDYLIWYNVTGQINSTTVNAQIVTENESPNFDGRVKTLTLVVAYNNGDSDQVKYWVNTGHDYQTSSDTTKTTTFATTPLIAGWTSAELTNVHLSSKDATYTFNTVSYTGANPVAPYASFVRNVWDVNTSLNAGSDSTLSYTHAASSSFKTILACLKVRYNATADLQVTTLAYNPGAGAVLFANEPNIIRSTVKNNGTVAAGSFDVHLTIGAYTDTKNIPGLTAGANTTVDFTNYTPTATGNVTVTVTADNNNQKTETPSVYYNGYKGKRFTNGSDMNTQASFDGRYGIKYSAGNTVYNSNLWTTKSYNWSAADLPLPAGATVTSARLYQGYAYNKKTTTPSFTMSFNSNTVTPVAAYLDRKGFGTYNYPYGLYVYDVTSQFNTAGNSITITPETGNDYALYGAYLVVVYQDNSTTVKKIFINDEFDNVWSRSIYSTSNDEATVYANFTGVDTSNVASAQAIAILASASDVNKSKFFFNGNENTGFWSNYLSGPQIGFSPYDVTGALTSGSNTAKLQSYDTAGNGDNMYAMTVILVAEYTTTAPVAGFTGTPTSGTAPLTVTFTDRSTGTPTSWSWSFGDGSTVNATVKNPVHTYASNGTYTVSLTATNAAGSNIRTVANYITVNAASDVDNVGVFRNGSFYLKDATSFAYGLTGDKPVAGDWNGDGMSEVGVFRSGVFYRNGADAVVYGLSTDIPVIGDWNGVGISEVGVFRDGVFYRNGADAIVYGIATDTPVVGDWNGDHISEVGVFRNGSFYLKDATSFAYGLTGDTPVAGDWNGDGTTEVGVFRDGVFYLRDRTGGTTSFAYGLTGDTPITGKWT